MLDATLIIEAVFALIGVVCSFYLNMAKSDHKEGGITFETAKAQNFSASENSPKI